MKDDVELLPCPKRVLKAIEFVEKHGQWFNPHDRKLVREAAKLWATTRAHPATDKEGAEVLPELEYRHGVLMVKDKTCQSAVRQIAEIAIDATEYFSNNRFKRDEVIAAISPFFEHCLKHASAALTPKPAEGVEGEALAATISVAFDEGVKHASGHALIADLENKGDKDSSDEMKVFSYLYEEYLKDKAEKNYATMQFCKEIYSALRRDHLASRRLIGRGWMPIEQYKDDNGEVIVSGESVFNDGTMYVCQAYGVHGIFYTEQGNMPNQPTHWQPLPAAPDDGGE